MDLKLNGKRALVFGASQGIGRAVAEVLSAEGVRTLICARNQDALAKTAKEISAAGFVTGDLTKQGEARRVALEAQRILGGVDIVVTNTGGPAKGHFAEISTEQWHLDFQNIWMSVVDSLNVLLPQMKENHYGRILMVTSIAGSEPLPALTTSNGLRAGLEGLCKSIANEYAPYGVTANVLRPGYTNTDRLKELKLSDEQVKKMVPAGRLGEPEELASLACFLASPRAGYITGQCMSIDGGVQRGY